MSQESLPVEVSYALLGQNAQTCLELRCPLVRETADGLPYCYSKAEEALAAVVPGISLGEAMDHAARQARLLGGAPAGCPNEYDKQNQ